MRLRTGGPCVCVCMLVWDSSYGVSLCIYVWFGGRGGGGGGLIVMHVDGFRDTSFQKQGPH